MRQLRRNSVSMRKLFKKSSEGVNIGFPRTRLTKKKTPSRGAVTYTLTMLTLLHLLVLQCIRTSTVLDLSDVEHAASVVFLEQLGCAYSFYEHQQRHSTII